MPSNPIKVILAIAALALGAGAAPAFVAASGDDGHGGHGGNSGHGGGHGGDDDHSTTDDDSTTTNDDSTTTNSTTTATSTTPAAGRAAARVLIATVTDDARISLRRKGGGATGALAPGKYTIRVSDTTSDHNFHLKGPGVDRKTTVDGRSTPTWSLTLRRGGTYRFVCDPHADSMKGSVRVRA